jgi:Ca-activated chloride channel family protein
MRFLSPWRLVFLVAPLALAAAYVVAQRVRQRYALRFTSVGLLASVAPRRPGWQRHVASAAVVGALVLLVLAFARPAHGVQVPRQRATVVLVLDTSGSMASTDVAPTRLAAAQQSARRFVSGLRNGIKVGLVAFDTNARVLVAPTTDRATVGAAIDQLTPGGGTATGDAISLALDSIASQAGGTTAKSIPAAVVLMSDGTPTIGHGDQSPAQTVASASAAAKQAHVPVDTIAFGTANGTVDVRGQTLMVPSDPAAMAQIAQDTGGKTFTAQSAEELQAVYGQIGRLVGYDTVTREITAGFTGVGIILLTVAAAAGIWWTQRIA